MTPTALSIDMADEPSTQPEQPMSQPITIRATLSAWLPEHKRPHELVELLEKGDAVRVASALWFYGPADKPAAFGNTMTRVGEAEITLRLLPQDEQVRMAVQGLQRKLEEERAKWLTRQQEILAEINKLQALEMAA